MRKISSVVRFIDPQRPVSKAMRMGVLAVLKKCDVSKFKKEPKPASKENKIDVLYHNLLAQFGITRKVLAATKAKYPKKDGFLGLSITNLGWTKNARDEFYSYDWHAKVYKKYLKGNMEWVMNHEPTDMDEDGEVADD